MNTIKTHPHAHAHTNTCTHMQKHTPIPTHAQTQNACTHMRTHIHLHTTFTHIIQAKFTEMASLWLSASWRISTRPAAAASHSISSSSCKPWASSRRTYAKDIRGKICEAANWFMLCPWNGAKSISMCHFAVCVCVCVRLCAFVCVFDYVCVRVCEYEVWLIGCVVSFH